MVKHIVLFKFKEMEDTVARKAIMQEFKSALESLKSKIPFLKFIEVGINENPREDFDMSLVTEFDSMEDLTNYASHPDHVAATLIIKDIKAGRACVDYTF
ncbi:Dabb family protein [Coprobacter sp.]